MEIEKPDTVPILERAKEAMHAKSDYELAQKLGITTATMSGYKKRKSLPLEQCLKIEEHSKVSLDWLILGKGNKYGTFPNPNLSQQFLSKKDLKNKAWLEMACYQFGENDMPLTKEEELLIDYLHNAVKSSNHNKFQSMMSKLHDNLSKRKSLNKQVDYLDKDKTMLLTGWDMLNYEQQDYIFNLIRRFIRGENAPTSLKLNIGQANAGNGNIENLNIENK